MAESEILVEVIRGPLKESMHRGHIAVTNKQGEVLFSAGNPYYVTFARSTMKPIQAIPVLEAGAVEAFAFQPEEIVLMCASHNGEKPHIEAVRTMLDKLRLDICTLQCGPHEPYHKPSADWMKQQGIAPSSLYNNCSGKHAGMLALAKLLGSPVETYMELSHPVQQRMLAVVSAMSGVAEKDLAVGTDGCGVPVFGLSLAALATAFARLGGTDGENPVRARACRQIVEAIRQHPFFLAGSGRFDTRLIEVTGGRVIGKMGAEGVFAVAVPDRDIGLAVKIEDGSQRGLYPAAAEALRQLGLLSDAEYSALADVLQPALRNWKGTAVGEIKPVFQMRKH